MKTTLVTTTINVPHLLRSYAHNAARFGHVNLNFVVVGDKKTPAEAQALCQEVSHIFDCHYLDVAAQQAFMEPYADLAAHIPYNCIQRRNIGMLFAYAHGADVVVTIDDDNFVTQGDYIGAQQIVGTRQALPTVHSTSGWINVCAQLACDDGITFYHRGYPHQQRWREKDAFVTQQPELRTCAVNAGFWLDDPDIGALDRMARQPTVRGRKQGAPPRFFLGHGTWSPFNSQNTALIADAIPAYFLSPFVGRYDDIWASYVICRIADQLNQAICFGEPWVRQARNPHDLMRDFDQERHGMQLTDSFVAALRKVELSGTSWASCFAQLTQQLADAWTLGSLENAERTAVREQLLAGMRLWHQACARAAKPRALACAARGPHEAGVSHGV